MFKLLTFMAYVWFVVIILVVFMFTQFFVFGCILAYGDYTEEQKTAGSFMLFSAVSVLMGYFSKYVWDNVKRKYYEEREKNAKKERA